MTARSRVSPTELLVYGVPIFFWAAMLLAPAQARLWVVVVVCVCVGYLLSSPTPERAIWTLLAYLFSIGGLSLGLYGGALGAVPGWVAWLSYVVIPLVAGCAWLMHRPWRTAGLAPPLAALLLVSLLGAVVHGTGVLDRLVNWLGWCLHFLRYPLLFLALINGAVSAATRRDWMRAFVVLAVMQIPATLIESIAWGVRGDRVVGTMYGAQTNLMGFTVAAALAAALSSGLVQRRSVWQLSGLALMFLPLVLGGTGFSIAVALVLIVYVTVRWGVRSQGRMSRGTSRLHVEPAVLAVASAGVVVGAAAVWAAIHLIPPGTFELADWLTGRNPGLTSWRAFADPQFAEAGCSANATGSRQMFIATTLQWFRAHPSDLLLGSTGPQVGLGAQGASLRRLLHIDFAGDPLQRISTAVGLRSGKPQSVVQLPRTLLEVGVVGLLCFAWLFVALWRYAHRALRRAPDDPWVRAQTFAFEAIWLMNVVLGVIYLDVWRLDHTGFALWLWAAALVGNCELRIANRELEEKGNCELRIANRELEEKSNPSVSPLGKGREEEGSAIRNPQSTIRNLDPLRILVLAPHAQIRSPLQRHTPHLVAALRDLGCMVTVAGWGRHAEQETLRDKVAGRVADIRNIRRILRRQPFDMLVVKTAHDWNTLSRDIPLLLATRSLCPHRVVQFHGSFVGRLVEPGHRLFKLASALLVRLADAVLVLSSEEQRQLQAFYPAGRFPVVMNPYVPAARPRDVDRRRLGVPNGVPVLLFVGRVMDAKGVVELIDALPAVLAATPCHLLMVGDGPLVEEIRRRAAQTGVSAHVTLAGYVEGEALQVAYHCADVFVLPSWTEGFSFALTEALNAGLPVVTTRIRGMADHLTEGVHTLFIPMRDPAALAQALIRLLGDAALRARMAAANREKVREFAPTVVAQQYLQVLRAVAGGGPLPDPPPFAEKVRTGEGT